MSLEKKFHRDTLVVKLSGEFDMVAAEEFRRLVDPELDRRQVRNLVVNLGGVSFIDSSGLGVILGRYKKLSQSGGKIWLAAPRPPVRKILELSGFPKIIKFFESEKQALEAVREA